MTNSEPQIPAETPIQRRPAFWAGIAATVVVLAALGYWGWRVSQTLPGGFGANQPTATAPSGSPQSALPAAAGKTGDLMDAIVRSIIFRTTLPTRTADWVTSYTVEKGDTVYSIAKSFGLKEASIVWGNIDLLGEDANFLRPKQTLNIMPIDGAYYQWKGSDSLDSVAATWNTTVDAILNWPGNGLDPLSPSISSGQWLILPGGWKPYDWEAPMIRNGISTTYALGAGVCLNGYTGPVGDGNWIWPTPPDYRWLSGNDFTPPTHPGIDIAVYLGMPINAVDNGVIVYAGWSQNRDGTPGYGNLVIIDHLDGWHTFYGHLSEIDVTCGEPIYQGMKIGLAGSTGNSTGPHLHFEMRYGGAPQNPHGLLP